MPTLDEAGNGRLEVLPVTTLEELSGNGDVGDCNGSALLGYDGELEGMGGEDRLGRLGGGSVVGGIGEINAEGETGILSIDVDNIGGLGGRVKGSSGITSEEADDGTRGLLGRDGGVTTVLGGCKTNVELDGANDELLGTAEELMTTFVELSIGKEDEPGRLVVPTLAVLDDVGSGRSEVSIALCVRELVGMLLVKLTGKLEVATEDGNNKLELEPGILVAAELLVASLLAGATEGTLETTLEVATTYAVELVGTAVLVVTTGVLGGRLTPALEDPTAGVTKFELTLGMLVVPKLLEVTELSDGVALLLDNDDVSTTDKELEAERIAELEVEASELKVTVDEDGMALGIAELALPKTPDEARLEVGGELETNVDDVEDGAGLAVEEERMVSVLVATGAELLAGTWLLALAEKKGDEEEGEVYPSLALVLDERLVDGVMLDGPGVLEAIKLLLTATMVLVGGITELLTELAEEDGCALAEDVVSEVNEEEETGVMSSVLLDGAAEVRIEAVLLLLTTMLDVLGLSLEKITVLEVELQDELEGAIGVAEVMDEGVETLLVPGAIVLVECGDGSICRRVCRGVIDGGCDGGGDSVGQGSEDGCRRRGGGICEICENGKSGPLRKRKRQGWRRIERAIAVGEGNARAHGGGVSHKETIDAMGATN
ncbi:uncharacterized protein MONBRDRAFT_10508 [Monosiga brevicollis MX1]|uniref:Uncharacterized protein n=1 Tax=Monosiga brevicollis TaxID=81824 RepID=A9V6K3_MONBE|nr:uncharacterized protein MONBRDRAFT_10508 [Monosiga brevicollis MX1]EDQ86822.1 predicted protein [Monosiga brevicollis MX1]|eukprot:XP_001748367.1 hypothetical protein [Monosiga brevicollis MX1]